VVLVRQEGADGVLIPYALTHEDNVRDEHLFEKYRAYDNRRRRTLTREREDGCGEHASLPACVCVCVCMRADSAHDKMRG